MSTILNNVTWTMIILVLTFQYLWGEYQGNLLLDEELKSIKVSWEWWICLSHEEVLLVFIQFQVDSAAGCIYAFICICVLTKNNKRNRGQSSNKGKGWKEMREGEIMHYIFPQNAHFIIHLKKMSKCSNGRNINKI